ncbi:hypothetical protein KCQ_07588 [Pectobacterium atrosepticum ICMP 1526]|nr:hypothetical protein KCQ_07588 [Pectobacterium atrosepticum ICMP 1526]
MLSELLAQVGGVGRDAGLRTEVGDQPGVAGAVLAGDDHGFLHAGTLHKAGLDFPQFDTEAAQLDLEVVTAEVFEAAVGQPAGQVTGLVETGTGLVDERVGNKALGGEVGAVEITAGDADAADMELTGDAEGHRLVEGIEDIELGIGDGAANGNEAAVVVRLTGPEGDVNGGFGGAIEVMELGVEAGKEALLQLGRQGFAAADDTAQGVTGTVCIGPLNELLEHGGHEVQGGDAGTLNELREVGRILVSVRAGHDEACTVEQGPEELPDGDVKAEGGLLQHAVIGGEAIGVLHPDEAVAECAVAVHDTLGLAGGAGGVDDVGQMVGIQTGDVRVVLTQVAEVGGIEQDARDVSGQQGALVRLSQQCDRAGIVEHVGEALGGVAGVKGNIGGAGLENGEQADDHVERALDANGDAVIGFYAEVDEVMRELVGAAVERVIGEVLVFKEHGGGIGGTSGLVLDELMDKGVVREVGLGGIEVEHDLPALTVR